ncbi:MAG: hypothetical protein QXQ77_03160 [Candidatus Aenigmatarchaeota archaeon]
MHKSMQNLDKRFEKKRIDRFPEILSLSVQKIATGLKISKEKI